MRVAPTAPLEVTEPDLLLELLIVPLDAPAQFGLAKSTSWRKLMLAGSVESQYRVGSASPSGHSMSSVSSYSDSGSRY
jgi:hypothetical protein